MTYLLGAVAGAAVIAASSLPAAAYAPAPKSAVTIAAKCGHYNGSATTKRGARGARVKEIQCILNRWSGGAALKVDGVFGARTESWVVHFQDVRGLRVDGIVGRQTWAALRAV